MKAKNSFFSFLKKKEKKIKPERVFTPEQRLKGLISIFGPELGKKLFEFKPRNP